MIDWKRERDREDRTDSRRDRKEKERMRERQIEWEEGRKEEVERKHDGWPTCKPK